MTHTELAERIDREGASRELDALIAGTDPATVQWHSEDETPAYTSSLDAVMTLYEGDPPEMIHSDPTKAAAAALRAKDHSHG